MPSSMQMTGLLLENGRARRRFSSGVTASMDELLLLAARHSAGTRGGWWLLPDQRDQGGDRENYSTIGGPKSGWQVMALATVRSASVKFDADTSASIAS